MTVISAANQGSGDLRTLESKTMGCLEKRARPPDLEENGITFGRCQSRVSDGRVRQRRHFDYCRHPLIWTLMLQRRPSEFTKSAYNRCTVMTCEGQANLGLRQSIRNRAHGHLGDDSFCNRCWDN